MSKTVLRILILILALCFCLVTVGCNPPSGKPEENGQTEQDSGNGKDGVLESDDDSRYHIGEIPIE